jgi:hypothetical protein
MEQNYGGGSTQPSIIISLGKTYPAGTAIALVDKQGNELFAHTAKKTLSALNYSAPELKQDAEYVLKIDGTDAISFTLSEAQATVSADGSVKSSTSGGMGGPGGARGDWGANGDGTMPTPPTDGTMPARPTDGTMPTPPADGTMPDFPEDGTMPAPPTDGSIPTPPTDGTMPDPRSDRGNTGTPPSSTESQNGSEQDVTQDNIQV